MSEITNAVLLELGAERARQDLKWGEQNHPNGTGAAVFAAMATEAKRLCDEAAKKKELTWHLILNEEFMEAMAEGEPRDLRAELIQVAAVAVGWIEAIDRAAKREGAARQLPDADKAG